jgi:chromosome segregation ATPase
MSVEREKYEQQKQTTRTWIEKYVSLEKLVEQLNEERDEFRRDLKLAKTQLREKDDALLQAERTIVLLEGRIEQLQEAKHDYKSRYEELKQDYREHQRLNRETK